MATASASTAASSKNQQPQDGLRPSRTPSSKGLRFPTQSIPMEFPSMALPTRAPVSALFRGAFQNGFLSIFYSVGSKPLELWDKQLRTGYLKRVVDYEIRSQTIEMMSNNVNTTFMTTPPGAYQSLGIRLPVLVLVVKNLNRYFLFEVQIMDDTNTRRRFKVCNYTPSVKIRPFSCEVPLKMEEKWNQVTVNLQEMTRKSFGTGYVETIRVQVHANCRLRRIYFCEKNFGEEDVPADFRTFVLGSNRFNENEAESSAQSSTGQSRRKSGAVLTDYLSR